MTYPAPRVSGFNNAIQKRPQAMNQDFSWLDGWNGGKSGTDHDYLNLDLIKSWLPYLGSAMQFAKSTQGQRQGLSREFLNSLTPQGRQQRVDAMRSRVVKSARQQARDTEMRLGGAVNAGALELDAKNRGFEQANDYAALLNDPDNLLRELGMANQAGGLDPQALQVFAQLFSQQLARNDQMAQSDQFHAQNRSQGGGLFGSLLGSVIGPALGGIDWGSLFGGGGSGGGVPWNPRHRRAA